MGNTKLCTQAEFARMHEVSRKTATQWKARGWLVFKGDRVDVEASNARLKKYRRDGVTQSEKATKVTAKKATRRNDETPNQAAERIAVSVAPYDLDEARRIKENYLALLNQLEYDQKSGAVVAVQDVAKVWSDLLARVRTRLLAIPSEVAPQAHRMKTVPEVQEAIRSAVTGALEELTSAGGA